MILDETPPKPEKPMAKAESIVVNMPDLPDFSPVLMEIQKSFAAHTATVSAALAEQSSRIDAVADASVQSAEARRAELMTKAIVGAIAEDRKPLEINIKLESPDQKPTTKTVRRNPDGSMTVVEG